MTEWKREVIKLLTGIICELEETPILSLGLSALSFARS